MICNSLSLTMGPHASFWIVCTQVKELILERYGPANWPHFDISFIAEILSSFKPARKQPLKNKQKKKSNAKSLWKVLEQWKCKKTTRVYPQRTFCSKALTANKSQSLSEGAASEAQVDSCLPAYSFLVKSANFASLHKVPQIQYLLVCWGFGFFNSAMQLSYAKQQKKSIHIPD